MSRELERTYEQRFTDEDARSKEAVWRELAGYLQRFVPPGGSVLDIACDRGYFIRNIRAAERWASDLRDMSDLLPGITFVQGSGLELARRVPADHFDLIFMSNYLEHLPSSTAVVEQLSVARSLLRPGGRVLILQPDIRWCGGAYWDFIDHHVPLTARSLREAAEVAGLATVKVIERFIPYTAKSRLPKHPLLVRAYLALPLAWRFLGQQALYLGARPT